MLPKSITCPCECHGHGVGHPCSIEGGCGHLHRAYRCARGARCVDRAARADREGQWCGAALDAPGLCVGCSARVATAIRELVGDVALLTGLIASGSASESEFVNGSHELAVPIRLGVDALRTEIDWALAFWAYHVSEKMADGWTLSDAVHSRQLPRITRAASYVANRLDTLVSLPIKTHPCWDSEGFRIIDKICTDTGMDGALHLLELHHRAYRVAGRTKLVHRLTPACPWCDQPTLVRDNGADKVHCENPACRNLDGSRREIEERHYDWFIDQTIMAEERRAREVQ